MLMATVSTPRLITAEEYEQLDDVLGFRGELIEGERVLSPNAVFAHAAVIKQLEKILESQLSELSVEPLQVVRETGWKLRDELKPSCPHWRICDCKCLRPNSVL
jgi:hypothetical protein